MLKEPRMIFGFLLLIVVGTLAGLIALGRVNQQDSFGLDIILGCFTTLAGGFATWAFGQNRKDPPS